MAYTFEDLKKMTATRLREIADTLDHEVLHGHSTMHKDELLAALCEALGIEAHEHHEVVGVDKALIKREIRDLKARRQQALEAGDEEEYRRILKRIHRLKRNLRRATV
ncbi:MAG: transcription termination factor Rho [Gemmatimonadota bacterium]